MSRANTTRIKTDDIQEDLRNWLTEQSRGYRYQVTYDNLELAKFCADVQDPEAQDGVNYTGLKFNGLADNKKFDFRISVYLSKKTADSFGRLLIEDHKKPMIRYEISRKDHKFILMSAAAKELLEQDVWESYQNTMNSVVPWPFNRGTFCYVEQKFYKFKISEDDSDSQINRDNIFYRCEQCGIFVKLENIDLLWSPCKSSSQVEKAHQDVDESGIEFRFASRKAKDDEDVGQPHQTQPCKDFWPFTSWKLWRNCSVDGSRIWSWSGYDYCKICHRVFKNSTLKDLDYLCDCMIPDLDTFKLMKMIQEATIEDRRINQAKGNKVMESEYETIISSSRSRTESRNRSKQRKSRDAQTEFYV